MHIQLYNVQKPEIFQDSNISDKTQIDLLASYDNSWYKHIVFDDDAFCIDNDDYSIMYDNKLYKCAFLENNHYHPSLSKTDSENLDFYPRSSKFESFKKLFDLLEFSVTDTVIDSTMSFANNSNPSLRFNQSQTSDRKTRTKYDPRPLEE